MSAICYEHGCPWDVNAYLEANHNTDIHHLDQQQHNTTDDDDLLVSYIQSLVKNRVAVRRLVLVIQYYLSYLFYYVLID